MKSLSSFLFSRPSYLEGCARILDFAGAMNSYNRSLEPDVIAAEADWTAVADDILEAFASFEASLPPNVRRGSTESGYGGRT